MYQEKILQFKYISCSYLSLTVKRTLSLYNKFKYISCSYLSMAHVVFGMLGTRLNTSHILIYQLRKIVRVSISPV